MGPEGSLETKARRDRFGRSAVEPLNRAAVGGFRNLAFFRSSDQLDPLRDRLDFRLLLLDLAFPDDAFAAAR
jgi:hypothetical protein